MKKEKKNQKGITLISLAITIVVLLILAGVSIATLTGDSGLLTKASEAKIVTAVGAVKEAIQLEQLEKNMDGKEVNPETLLAEGKVKRIIQPDDGSYYMYYTIKPEAYEGMQGLGKGTVATLRDVFLIDDEFHVKYIDKSGKEYGDSINNKTLEDETEIRFASKAFSEYVSRISGVTEKEMKFKWMKNQTSLTIADSSVDSLEDLVFFPNLESIYLMNLTLENLDGIENCIKLNSFQSYSNYIKDYMQLAKLKNIKDIHIAGGNQQFDKIMDAIKDLTNIKTLELRSIGIVDMHRIAEVMGLTVLNLEGNKIDKIEGLEEMQELQGLNLSNNKIVDIIPLKYNTGLIDLNLTGNTNIDGNKENYTGERLEGLNEIGKIFDRGGNIQVDIEQLRLFNGYKRLNLSGKNLDNLEVLDGITTLEVLILNSNNITLQDEKSKEIIKNMKNLKSLYLEDNQVSDISVLNTLKNLTELRIRGEKNTINLSQIQDILPNLSLYVSGKQLETINDCTNTEQITRLTVYGVNTMPDISKLNNLKQLTCITGGIKDYSNLLKISSLERLSMYSSELHGKLIDFSKLPNVKYLDLRYNYLNSEDIEILANLKNHTNVSLVLSNNSIIDASALLVLDTSCKIDLRNNVNLAQESKDKLKVRFGSNVSF